jgi:hypothetical protein
MRPLAPAGLLRLVPLDRFAPEPNIRAERGMTASEERTYERARGLWLGLGERLRRDSNITPTFGATVSSHQLLGSQTLMFVRSVLRSLL